MLCFYHHGDTGDLKQVIDLVVQKYDYTEIVLIGFRMGGSLSLRVVSENPESVPLQIKKIIAFYVPCDLLSA